MGGCYIKPKSVIENIHEKATITCAERLTEVLESNRVLMGESKALAARLQAAEGENARLKGPMAPPEGSRRGHMVASAGYWFSAAQQAMKRGGKENMAMAVSGMENAYNHAENALHAAREERDTLKADKQAAEEKLAQVTRERDTLAEVLKERIGALPEEAPVLRLAEMVVANVEADRDSLRDLCRELARDLTPVAQSLRALKADADKSKLAMLRTIYGTLILAVESALHRAESLTGRKG